MCEVSSELLEHLLCGLFTLSLCLFREVSDLVLIDPIPEDVFEEEKWQQFW